MKYIDNLLCKLGYHHTKNICLAITKHPILYEAEATFYCTNCEKKFFQKKNIDLGIIEYLQTIKPRM